MVDVSGGVAQLGARLNGIQKARGSNPLVSTRRRTVKLFFIKNKFGIKYQIEDWL